MIRTVLVQVRESSERDQLLRRVEAHRARLRRSLEAVQENAVALTPAHQVRASPLTWFAGALAIGFVLGVVTAPRS